MPIITRVLKKNARVLKSVKKTVRRVSLKNVNARPVIARTQIIVTNTKFKKIQTQLLDWVWMDVVYFKYALIETAGIRVPLSLMISLKTNEAVWRLL